MTRQDQRRCAYDRRMCCWPGARRNRRRRNDQISDGKRRVRRISNVTGEPCRDGIGAVGSTAISRFGIKNLNPRARMSAESGSGQTASVLTEAPDQDTGSRQTG